MTRGLVVELLTDKLEVQGSSPVRARFFPHFFPHFSNNYVCAEENYILNSTHGICINLHVNVELVSQSSERSFGTLAYLRT